MHTAQDDKFMHFLRQIHIDPQAFAQHEQTRFQEWRDLFAVIHPNSWYEQKRFLLNALRKKYPLPQEITKK